RDQAADRLRVGHRGAAGLAERREDLERTALLVLVDRDVQVAERARHAVRLPRVHLRAVPLVATLLVALLGLQELRAELIDLVLQLVDPLARVGERRLGVGRRRRLRARDLLG